MAQGKGMPKMTQSGAGYNVGTGPKLGQGTVKKPPGFRATTPTYANTAITHQGVTKKSGK